MYKNDPLNICMKQLTSQEQYEFVRIVLESKTENISVCKHGATNAYIDRLFETLHIEFKPCFAVSEPRSVFE
jgi:hypothetical protein